MIVALAVPTLACATLRARGRTSLPRRHKIKGCALTIMEGREWLLDLAFIATLLRLFINVRNRSRKWMEGL